MKKNNNTLDLEAIAKEPNSKTTTAYLGEQKGKRKARRNKASIVKRSKGK